MTIYHKINSVYKRDGTIKGHPIMKGVFSTPELEALKDIKWRWDEKIDGTNIRIYWAPTSIDGIVVAGRSDRAQIPAPLLGWINENISVERMREVFNLADVCLYGEGFGGKIQKAGATYGSPQRFCLFDVQVGGMWLERHNVVDIADSLGIQYAPTIGYGTLESALALSEKGFTSLFAAPNNPFNAEGLIMRPASVELFDRRGNRIITKTKHKDFR